jgi:branched-chain amino acid transport system substrate-binding protein
MSIAATVLGACSTSGDPFVPTTVPNPTTTTTPVRPDDGTLSIGVLLPTTGNGAPLGAPMIEAIEEAVASINDAGGVLGSDVQLTVRDENAGTGFDELLTGGVDAIVGPASSLVALSQLDHAIAPNTGVVTCSPSATALALDDFPDPNKFFFRTAPSDSLQMVAISRRAERTGATSVAIGYLDDPYGRSLNDALTTEISARERLDLLANVGFSGDQEDLSDVASQLVEGEPGVIVVLGDTNDGSRLLAALDEAVRTSISPRIIINDAIRGARQTIAGLSAILRARLEGVAPFAGAITEDGPEAPFAAHAVDCVNLIALAAIDAQSDAPIRIRANMASVSVGGFVCTTFADCAAQLSRGLRIDYNGASGSVEFSNAGELVGAWFEVFEFGADGNERPERSQRILVP